MANRPTITDYKKTGLPLPIRPFTRDELDKTFEELANGQVNYEAVDREYVFKEEVARAIKELHDKIAILEQGVSFQKATQRLVISSNELSTTDVANDTITCYSQTPYEFDFTDSRRFTKVVLSPGAGVQPHTLRLDKVVKTGDTDYPQSVYAVSATKLQLVHWDGSAWNGLAWDTGWVVDLTQYIDGDLPVI